MTFCESETGLPNSTRGRDPYLDEPGVTKTARMGGWKHRQEPPPLKAHRYGCTGRDLPVEPIRTSRLGNAMEDAQRPMNRTVHPRFTTLTRRRLYACIRLSPMSETPSDSHYDTWKRQAPLGLLAVGFGASLLGHATLQKGEGEPTWKWVATGTASLAALGAGLSLFGDAVKHRTLYDLQDAA